MVEYTWMAPSDLPARGFKCRLCCVASGLIHAPEKNMCYGLGIVVGDCRPIVPACLRVGAKETRRKDV